MLFSRVTPPRRTNRDLSHLHDCTLSGLSQNGASVYIDVLDIPAPGPKTARVSVEGVRGLLRNGQTVSHLSMEAEDGEVLEVSEEDGSVILTIQWNDFTAKHHDIVVYTLLDGKIGAVS